MRILIEILFVLLGLLRVERKVCAHGYKLCLARHVCIAWVP